MKYAILATCTAVFVAIISATIFGCFLIRSVEWHLTVGTDLMPAVKVISRTALMVVPVCCLVVLAPALQLNAKLSGGWKPKQARALGGLLGLLCCYAWGTLKHGGIWAPQLQDKRVWILALVALFTGASFAFNYATLIQNRLRKRSREDLF